MSGPLPLLKIPELRGGGLRHAFTTREGGLSKPPFGTLNLGFSTGDVPYTVQANRRLASRYIGQEGVPWYLTSQVHGTAIFYVEATTTIEEAASEKADILITSVPGKILGMLTADCVPLIVWDPDHRAVGLAHAGWRGTWAGAAETVVYALRGRYGSDPGRLKAGIGPCIRAPQYEVGEVVAAPFRARYTDAETFLPLGENGVPHLDLPKALTSQLTSLGVPGTSIFDLGLCTAQDGRFFSHRRDGARTGRQGTAVWIEES